MAKITVLDNNMINMIAAGEVVERPASVVKEMLENSIDAQATRITVNVEQGGQKLISVTDNGCGISEEDMPTAFAPHATSKIQTVEDLAAIKSMGFRGEALASIASVAKVKVVSRTRDSISAHTLVVDCGQMSEVAPCSSDYGTTFEVRDLFYKLPARRKFLRTVNTEFSHITEHFTRIALAQNSIEFGLTHNGRQTHHLPSGQNTLERIGTLFSREVEDCLLYTYSQEKSLSIRAYISRPSIVKANNKLQYIFLNGRYIRDKFISHAIKEAYRGFLEPNKFPIVFLFLEMPFDAYDVNVHPTKTEIRFDNPNMIHSQVLAVLREKLMDSNVQIDASLPTRNFDKSPLDQVINRVQDGREQRITDAMDSFFKKNPSPQRHLDFKPSGVGQGFQHSSPRKASFNLPKQSSEFEFDLPSKPISFEFSGSNDVSADDEQQKPVITEYLQVHDSYIVLQNEQGFEIIDQHALHERIIYEQLYNRICAEDAASLPAQRLLIPETIELTDAQGELVEQNRELFKQLGININSFGPSTYAIQSFPAMLGKVNPSEFVREIVDIIDHTGVKPEREKLLHHILDMASCKAAIKAGQKLSAQEIEHLLEQRNSTARCGRCPHGRPTSIQFSLKDLEKQFKRTGF